MWIFTVAKYTGGRTDLEIWNSQKLSEHVSRSLLHCTSSSSSSRVSWILYDSRGDGATTDNHELHMANLMLAHFIFNKSEDKHIYHPHKNQFQTKLSKTSCHEHFRCRLVNFITETKLQDRSNLTLVGVCQCSKEEPVARDTKARNKMQPGRLRNFKFHKLCITKMLRSNLG